MLGTELGHGGERRTSYDLCSQGSEGSDEGTYSSQIHHFFLSL